MEAKGHSIEFLQGIDLAGKDKETGAHKQHMLFQSSNLIYTIRDEFGAPVGFSARNLKYEKDLEDYKSGTSKWEPRKYINTRNTPIYEKKKILFNFNEAKKSSHKAVVIFEGNADAVTAYAGGLKAATATLGTAFTAEHLALLEANEMKHVGLCFDNDKGGREATERVTALLEAFGNKPGIKVEVIHLPAGVKDADEYIRSFEDLKAGVDAFRSLPRTDLLTWNLKRRVREGADAGEVCKEQVALIMLNPNHIDRAMKVKSLAYVSGVPEYLVNKELFRQMRIEELGGVAA